MALGSLRCLTRWVSDTEPEAGWSIDQREAELDRREAVLEARETALAHRMEAAQRILAAADHRDGAADDRDLAAEKLSNDRDREAFVTADADPATHWPERREAAAGRQCAKDDRSASKGDRVALTKDGYAPH